MLVGGAWLQFAKYSLAEIPRDPATMLVGSTVASVAGVGLGLFGSSQSAKGQLAAGQAAQQAGELDAQAALGSAELSATAATNSARLTADASLKSSELLATGQEMQGDFAVKEAGFEATELKQNASTARATSQRQAFDIDTQTRLALSTLTARASGSGLNASGATPVAVARSIGERGTYLALSEMAGGENVARGLEDEATAKLVSGDAAKYGSVLAALGTRYAGKTTADAAIYQGDAAAQAARYAGTMSAAASRLKGNAALTASQYGAAGTIASGAGSALTKVGSLMYPAPAGRTGASV